GGRSSVRHGSGQSVPPARWGDMGHEIEGQHPPFLGAMLALSFAVDHPDRVERPVVGQGTTSRTSAPPMRSAARCLRVTFASGSIAHNTNVITTNIATATIKERGTSPSRHPRHASRELAGKRRVTAVTRPGPYSRHRAAK